MKSLHYLILGVFTGFLIACGGGSGGSGGEEPEPEKIEHISAGDATVFEFLAGTLERHSANLATSRLLDFNLGNDFFKQPWVPNQASTSNRDGLGPHFNNNACQDCHIRDGRGHAADDVSAAAGNGFDFDSMLIRAAKSSITAQQEQDMLDGKLANVGDTAVGGQLQHDANVMPAAIQKETNLRVSYTTENIVFDDGYSVELRRPVWHMTSNYAGSGYDFDSDTVFSARVAPPMSGLGLLALIPESTILANEDVDDENMDGISGKANHVWDIESSSVKLGRFGWKAGQPSLLQQTAGAFLGDMGLTSRLFSTENCMPHQADCLIAPNGNGDSVNAYNFEVSNQVLDRVAFYAAHLAVPARRDAYTAEVQAGKALFKQAGCIACHKERYTTGSHPDFPELSTQIIFPYTDLLLHDMGEDLADFTVDNNPAAADILVEYQASSREWRTPPLWGLGIAQIVDSNATFLHDGRARTILEAVLWHGGEAEAARNYVLGFDADQRQKLLAFLSDL